MRQSMMPTSSLLRGARLASSTCPPGRSAASNSTTSWPALGSNTRRFESAGTGPDDHHFAAWAGAARDDVRHRGLAAGGGIVHADRVIAFVDTIQAIGGADAGTDLVLPSLHQPAADIRFGNVGARHADHVELARGDGVSCRGNVLDAGGVEHREFRRVAHFTGEVEMRRGAHALDRDDAPQCRVTVHMAADDVEEIHLSRCDEAVRDRDALRRATGRCPSPRQQPCGRRR